MKKGFTGLLMALFAAAALAQSTSVPLTPLQVTVTPTLVTITGGAAPLTIPVPKPACGAQPASTVATIACPAGTAGSWQQTTSYVSAAAPTCWTPALSPTSAPAGACTATAPSGTPPQQVVAGGKNLWKFGGLGGGSTDFNYGNIGEADGSTAPDGSLAIKFTASSAAGAHPGGGAFQPYWGASAGANNYNPVGAGMKWLVVVVMPTRAGQTWSTEFLSANDTEIPGAPAINPAQYCTPAMTPSVWSTCKIPLTALPNAPILKFNWQDQLAWTSPSTSAGNVWYMKDAHFSVN